MCLTVEYLCLKIRKIAQQSSRRSRKREGEKKEGEEDNQSEKKKYVSDRSIGELIKLVK